MLIWEMTILTIIKYIPIHNAFGNKQVMVHNYVLHITKHIGNTYPLSEPFFTKLVSTNSIKEHMMKYTIKQYA